ncbi:hypothetical protein DPMN_165462 [Dreissena polymorpha]|uniref:Secreted protein n=1 Tax=Dreissena polymorpha TaxID=45954 RepID=A0A9D4IWE9_DREPO|nr:hypothetical protein DPMN_165462 [Dreissena polymorpha]
MTKDWVHSFGHFFFSKIFWQSVVIAAVVASPRCSEGTLPTTREFPAFKLLTSSSNSAFGMDFHLLLLYWKASEGVWYLVETGSCESRCSIRLFFQDCGTFARVFHSK